MEYAMRCTERDRAVGKKIKEAMKARGVDVKSLAAKLCCGERTVFYYMQRGIKTTKLLTDVANLLNVSADWLLERKGPFQDLPMQAGESMTERRSDGGFAAGNQIKAAMKARGVDAKSLAEELNCCDQAVFRYWKQGVKTTRLLIEIADILNVSIDWLLERKGPFANPGEESMTERKARVLTKDELRDLRMGYGWMEIRPEEGESAEMDELMMRIAWVDGYTVEVDCLGASSNGFNIDLAEDFDGRERRIWTGEPTLEQRRETPWRTH